MALSKTLLAGVALPFIALSFVAPAQATVLRPAVAVEAGTMVIKVSEVSEARRRLQAAREALAAAKASGGDVAAAKAEVQAARAALQAAQAANQGGQDIGEEGEQPKKRKKQQQAEDLSGQEPDFQNMEPVEQEQPKKRKKQQQAEDLGGQDGNVQIVEPSTEEMQPVEQPKKRKKQQQSEEMTGEDPAVEVLGEGNGEQPKKRKKQQQAQDVEGQDGTITIQNPDGSIEVIETVKKKRDKKTDNANAGDVPETVEKVKRRKDLAKDPSKTNEVIELPVENGAPVLDSEKDIEKTADKATQEKRRKLREERRKIAVPKSDLDAQREALKKNGDIVIKPIIKIEGDKIARRPDFVIPNGRTVEKGGDVRVIFNIDNRVVVRVDDDRRLARNGGQIRYEALSNGRIKEIIVKPDGDKIITIRNKYGEIIRRSRIDRRGVEIVIFFSPDLDRGRERLFLRDPGILLPPMRLTIPVDEYIIDTSSRPNRNFVDFLDAPPVEPVERVYSLDEVKYSARIRDKVRRIDLDTITFNTGSADISMSQASSLRRVADAIQTILDRDPGETFLIEGHTDAVGSDESNLVLSDMRAESVAQVLTDVYDIPAENLATQGYGERFLKVDTDGPERLNRRVTIRRVTALVRPMASAE